MGHKGPKFTLLVIEILVYFHPERSPAARRCACFCLISFSSGGVLAATSENDTMSVTFNDVTVNYIHTFC